MQTDTKTTSAAQSSTDASQSVATLPATTQPAVQSRKTKGIADLSVMPDSVRASLATLAAVTESKDKPVGAKRTSAANVSFPPSPLALPAAVFMQRVVMSDGTLKMERTGGTLLYMDNPTTPTIDSFSPDGKHKTRANQIYLFGSKVFALASHAFEWFHGTPPAVGRGRAYPR